MILLPTQLRLLKFYQKLLLIMIARKNSYFIVLSIHFKNTS